MLCESWNLEKGEKGGGYVILFHKISASCSRRLTGQDGAGEGPTPASRQRASWEIMGGGGGGGGRRGRGRQRSKSLKTKTATSYHSNIKNKKKKDLIKSPLLR